MKRMWSKNELKNISQNEAKAVKKDIATLVDAQGHDRFIEGDITIEEISGVTQTYGKWSLSGSHLLIVLAFDAADTTAFTNGVFAYLNDLPQWLNDKIVVLWGNEGVDRKEIMLFADDYTSQTMSMFLQKDTQGRVRIYNGNLTLTKDRHGRVAFDLLIV